MQRSALCRSRRELSNAYLLAKIGVDIAENEPLEVWGENSIQYSLHSLVGIHPGNQVSHMYLTQYKELQQLSRLNSAPGRTDPDFMDWMDAEVRGPRACYFSESHTEED